MRIIILGSGTSQGIPIIGCKCATCTSENPKDKRLRVSAYIEIPRGELGASKDLKLLIDTSSDFRQQMLANNLNNVDAVLFTHTHVDHIMGLDDIRQINQLHKKAVDIYGSEDTINYIRNTFRYIWDSGTYPGGGIPKLNPHILKLENFKIQNVEITPVEYFHGPSVVLGYRIGNFAYLTDCSEIPERTFSKLQGTEILVIDALRFKPHPTHFSIDQALEASGKIAPRRTYFIHMTHDLMHDETNAKLPAGAELAYDGLEINV